MKILASTTLASMLALTTPAASAAPADSAELLHRCTALEKSMGSIKLTSGEALDAMWCMGYISGLLDGFSISDFRIGETPAACPPDVAISRTQALGIIMTWLREHPDDLDKSGRRSAIIALTKAFPCNKQ